MSDLAFPTWVKETRNGMTLRDYFAARAMEGRVAGRCSDIGNDSFNEDTCNGIARVSYMLADAMLKAREVKP